MFRRFFFFLKCLFRIAVALVGDAFVYVILAAGLGSSIISFAKECGFYGWYFWPIVVILVIVALVCEYLWAVGYFSGENKSYKGHEDRAARKAEKEREKEREREERNREWEEERERRRAEREEQEERNRINSQANFDAFRLIHAEQWAPWDFETAEDALSHLKDGQMIKDLRAKMTKESLRKQ